MARMDLNSMPCKIPLCNASTNQHRKFKVHAAKRRILKQLGKGRTSVEKSLKGNQLKTENTCFWQWWSGDCEPKTVCHQGYCLPYTNRKSSTPHQEACGRWFKAAWVRITPQTGNNPNIHLQYKLW